MGFAQQGYPGSIKAAWAHSHVYLPHVKNLFNVIMQHWYTPTNGTLYVGFLHLSYDKVGAIPSEHAAYPLLFLPVPAPAVRQLGLHRPGVHRRAFVLDHLSGRALHDRCDSRLRIRGSGIRRRHARLAGIPQVESGRASDGFAANETGGGGSVAWSPSQSVRPPGGSLRVFILSFIVFAYFMPQWADWNIDSQIDLVHALVDEHTVRIDTYNANTWDKAFFKNHFYSDKAPGTAVLGAVAECVLIAKKALVSEPENHHGLEKNSAWNTAVALGRTNTQLQPAKKGQVLGGCQRCESRATCNTSRWGNRLYRCFGIGLSRST